MTIEQLRKRIEAQPFLPFVIHLADGRELHVPHRDFISHSPQGRTFIVWDTEDDACEFVDLLLVTSLELKSSDQKNGKGGSKKTKGGKRKK